MEQTAQTTHKEPSISAPPMKLDSMTKGAAKDAAAKGLAEKDAIELTAKAIEMGKKALRRRGTPEAAIRLGVRGGGCSGVSYAIEFTDKIRAKDNTYVFDGLRIVIDPKSLVYLRGCVLDYEVKLMEHGFKFRNPNVAASCGCGESFGI